MTEPFEFNRGNGAEGLHISFSPLSHQHVANFSYVSYKTAPMFSIKVIGEDLEQVFAVLFDLVPGKYNSLVHLAYTTFKGPEQE